MKTLLLMRHAKSSWKHPELADHDRPLTKRGCKDVPRMYEILEDQELIPQVILCSSAVRTKETAELLLEKVKEEVKVDYLDSFYLAEPQVYIQAVASQPDEIERVMVIGHNPGLEGALQILSGRIESLPTGAVAYLALPISHWSELSTTTEGDLVEFWRPRELKDEKEAIVVTEKSKQKAKKAKAKIEKKPKEKDKKEKEKEKEKEKTKEKAKGKKK